MVSAPLTAPRQVLTTTATASTLYPFASPAERQPLGAPIGLNLHDQRIFYYDPYSATVNGGQQAAQLGIVAANGLGKSHLAKLIATAMVAQNIPIIVPADFKSEWNQTVNLFGGRTFVVSRTGGGLNLADPGELILKAYNDNADPDAILELETRRNENLIAVLGINRDRRLEDTESSIIRAAANLSEPGSGLKGIGGHLNRETILAELGIPGNESIAAVIDNLKMSFIALQNSPIGRGLGESNPDGVWPIDKSLSVDTSSVPETEQELSAATAITAWTAAQSAVFYARQTNPDGLWSLFFDEIWRATRNFPKLADLIGGLLRMDRDRGLVTVLITHSWSDTQQRGGSNILNRCAALALGGMQQGEAERISVDGQQLTQAERAVLARNSSGSSANGATGGVGKFLFKIGDGPGIEMKTANPPSLPTDTNQRWARGIDGIAKAVEVRQR